MKREIGIIGMIICIGMGFSLGWFIPAFLPEEECPDCPDCPDCPECPELPVEEEPLIDQIVSRGQLIVGTTADYPPFENFTYPFTGEIEGFDVDLSQMIADELNVTLNMTHMPFDTLITACNASTIDMIAAAMTYTEARAEILAASITYITMSKVVIVEAGSPLTTINNLTDLVGYDVGCILDTQMQFELESIPGMTVSAFASAISLIQDLVSGGGIDAAYVEEPIFTAWNQSEDLRVIYSKETYTLVLWCKYGEPELLYVINKVIHEAYLNGTIYNLMKKWFK